MSRNLDDLVRSIEHAEPLHPFKNLRAHHFYLDGLVDTEGGLWWLLMMDGLLLVPLIFAGFFYPIQALAVGAAVVLIPLIGYQSYVMWRRRHPRP